MIILPYITYPNPSCDNHTEQIVVILMQQKKNLRENHSHMLQVQIYI